MLRYKKLIPLLLVLGLVLSFASCASDTASDAPVSNNGKVYLSVAIHVSGEDETATRAEDKDKYTFEPYPFGGEHGNGDFKGEEYEREVKNLSLLFYTSSRTDLTDDEAQTYLTDDEARIEKVIYFPEVIMKNKRTNAVEVDSKFLAKNNLRFLVIANTNDLSNYLGRTVADVRDQLITNVFNRSEDASFTTKGELSGFSSFVMSSHGNGYLKYSGSGTEEDPYLIDHEIERMAARIDIMPHVPRYNLNDKTKLCKYCYDVMEGSNVVGGFVLEYVRPYNVLTSQEYVFKRTATDKNLTDLTYLGLEKGDGNENGEKSTNYVVDPTSLNKSQATFLFPKNTPEYWAVDEYADFYQTRDAGKTHTWSSGTKATSSDSFDPEKSYYILDYVKENTSFDNDEQYATGLVFKGKYYEKNDWVVAVDTIPSHPKATAVGKDKAYTYVIRHSDPEGSGTTSDPMHYGIVRNNVYRVRIDGIQGKGPDGMKLSLQVRKWATYTHDEVTM